MVRTAQKMSAPQPSITHLLMDGARRPVDARARARAAMHWLDWVGCVAAGARSPAGDALRRMPRGDGRTTSLLGSAADDWQATLFDAAPANVEEMDDMDRQAILHPGPVVMPALAGLARDGMPTGRVLDAVVRGYEVMIRIGRTVGARHYFYWHNTATVGVFGAAAACADAMDLSPEQAVWALGHAGTQAAGLWQVRLEPSMSKQLHTAHAAWAGRSGAALAAAGFTGPARILEGERGFFAAMCPDGRPDLVLQPAPDWLIHDTSFKPWPACRHTHAAIDCALALRQAQGGSIAFQDCVVESYSDALAMCDNPAPQTRTEAKFSLQYCVAAALLVGPLQPTHFEDAARAAARVLESMRRVRVRASPGHDAAYPSHYGARVTLVLEDGSRRTHAVDDALGDPERPMDLGDLVSKAETLMAYGGVAPARALQAIQAAIALCDATPQDLAQPFPAALLRPLFDHV